MKSDFVRNLICCQFLVVVLGLRLVLANEITGHAEVIDGDSLRITGEEIRLIAIDAPEWQQTCQFKGEEWACGRAAAEALGMLVTRSEIRCLWDERDQHGRALATCYRRDIDLNAMMVEIGMALAYRYYSGTYIEQEDIARKLHRGIWDAEFTEPWEWRRQQQSR